jgi:hypothetical protein
MKESGKEKVTGKGGKEKENIFND